MFRVVQALRRCMSIMVLAALKVPHAVVEDSLRRMEQLFEQWGGVEAAVNSATGLLECQCHAARVEAAEQALTRCNVEWGTCQHTDAQLRNAPEDEVRCCCLL
jgi:hypothetical protein